MAAPAKEATEVRPERLQGWAREGRTVRLDYGGPVISLSAVGPATLRMRLAPTGELAARRSWAVAKENDEVGHPDRLIGGRRREVVHGDPALG